jgi:hypothetical protein
MIKELGDLLAADDTRWLWFGLNMPSGHEGADRVEALALQAIPHGFIAVWAHPSRAVRYYVEIKVDGIDADYRRVQTVVHETRTSLTDLPGNVSVEVRIIAINEAGVEAEPSDPKSLITGS